MWAGESERIIEKPGHKKSALKEELELFEPERRVLQFLFSYCAPGGARFLRVQVPNPPGSGKDIAEGKGVHREVESEGSRMWGIY